MADEDLEPLVPTGQGSALSNAGGGAAPPNDRRAPRFSWTPAYEATFFRSLCDSVALGLRENSSFKAEAWERAAQALHDKHGAAPTKSHLINKSDNARKRFRLWRGLREDPDFVYDQVTKTVSASEDAWKAHIEREPLSRALRGRPFDHEDFMEVLYPDVIGSGGAPKRVMKPRRRADGQPGDDLEMPGTSILNLQSDHGASVSSASPSSRSLDSPHLQRPPLSQTPSGSSTSSSGSQPLPLHPHQHQHQRPLSTTLPPRGVAAGSSVLTPPEETTMGGRKRRLSGGPQPGAFDSLPPPSKSPLSLGDSSASAMPDKRVRTGRDGLPPMPPHLSPRESLPYMQPSPSSHQHGSSRSAHGAPSPSASASALAPASHAALVDDIVTALGPRLAPQWCADALDLFFRDFADERPDVQLHIAENVLSSEARAVVFCKMPPRLRQRWVARFRGEH